MHVHDLFSLCCGLMFMACAAGVVWEKKYRQKSTGGALASAWWYAAFCSLLGIAMVLRELAGSSFTAGLAVCLAILALACGIVSALVRPKASDKTT